MNAVSVIGCDVPSACSLTSGLIIEAGTVTRLMRRAAGVGGRVRVRTEALEHGGAAEAHLIGAGIDALRTACARVRSEVVAVVVELAARVARRIVEVWVHGVGFGTPGRAGVPGRCATSWSR
ncbi:hypothetical protein [Kitasatospora sp. NPDC094011]|uniref:hypothetical protein n=1 Tax=Kitasatospora sp. NPDC094011 TaxID=3364090 RepID=UPI0038028DCE